MQTVYTLDSFFCFIRYKENSFDRGNSTYKDYTKTSIHGGPKPAVFKELITLQRLVIEMGI